MPCMDEGLRDYDAGTCDGDARDERRRLSAFDGTEYDFPPEKQGFRGMLSVSDILRVVASDEKARADLLESFIFPQQ